VVGRSHCLGRASLFVIRALAKGCIGAKRFRCTRGQFHIVDDPCAPRIGDKHVHRLDDAAAGLIDRSGLRGILAPRASKRPTRTDEPFTSGIGFEEIVFHIEPGDLLDILEHPNPERYGGQRILVVRREDYVYLVPFVEEEHTVFLKTIIPSRKATKQYLGEESGDED
jgi:hypothetical protein